MIDHALQKNPPRCDPNGGEDCTMRSYHSAPPVSTDKLIELTVALANQRHEAEWELAASVLPDPATLIPIAQSEGVEPGLFHSEDLRTIFCCALVVYDLGVAAVRQLAVTALKKYGEWDEGAPHWFRGGLHSEETLDALFGAYFKCAAVRNMAKKLWSIHNRQMLAADFLVRAERLLTNDDTLADELKSHGIDYRAATSKPRIALMPMRCGRRGAA